MRNRHFTRQFTLSLSLYVCLRERRKDEINFLTVLCFFFFLSLCAWVFYSSLEFTLSGQNGDPDLINRLLRATSRAPVMWLGMKSCVCSPYCLRRVSMVTVKTVASGASVTGRVAGRVDSFSIHRENILLLSLSLPHYRMITLHLFSTATWKVRSGISHFNFRPLTCLFC